MVDGQAACKVQWLIATTHEDVAQRRSGRPEGYCLELGTIVRCQREADVPTLANNLGKAGPVGGKRKYWRGIARSIWSGALEVMQEIYTSSPRGQRGIDLDRRGGTGSADTDFQPIRKEGPERAEITSAQADERQFRFALRLSF